MAGGGRQWTCALTPRRDGRRARRGRSAARASAPASSTTIRRRIYLDGNSLGRLPLATRDRLAAVVAQWGERARLRLARLDRRPRARRRPARRARPRRAPRRGDRRRLDHGQPLQAVRRRARDARGRARHRPRQLPHRPLRARGPRRPQRPRAAAGRHARGGGRASAAPRSCVLSHVGYRSGEIADMAALTAATDADVVWDLSHSAGAIPVDLRAERRRARRRLHLQVPQRRPRRARLPLRRGGAPGGAALADLGLVRPARPVRDGARLRPAVDGIGRFQAGTPPILALAAVEEGVKLTAEAGIAAIRAKSISAHRADRRAPRRLAGAARLRASAHRATRRCAARTSRVRHPEAWPINRRADRARDRSSPTSAAPTRSGSASRRSTPATPTSGTRSTASRGLVERGEHRLVDAAPGRVT